MFLFIKTAQMKEGNEKQINKEGLFLKLFK